MTDSEKTGSDKPPGKFKRARRVVGNYLVEILNVIVILATVVAGSYGENLLPDGWLWLLLIGVSAILMFIVQVRRTPYTKLKAEKEAAESRLRTEKEAAEERAYTRSEALEQSLAICLRQILEVAEINNGTTRASAYFYIQDGEVEQFVMVARYSANPSYRVTGRGRYPVDQGVIGKAWHRANGYFAVRHLPKDRTAWNEKLVESYAFTPEEAKNLTMQAVSIGALRIHDNDGAVGMLVIETQNSHGVTNDLLERVQSSHVWEIFSEFMATFAPITPRVEVVTVQEDVPEDWMPTQGLDNG